MGETPFFPLFVPLEGRRVTVFGGGRIALRRVRALLDFSPQLYLVSPECCPELRALAESGEITWRARGYAPQDVAGNFLCLAATGSREVNRSIGEACRAAGVPVNVADCKEECDFYFPALAREGPLVAGITASGTNHTLAKQAVGAVRALFLAHRDQQTWERDDSENG